jgi:hypothetical protein
MYSHLSSVQRQTIESLHEQGHSMAAIARKIGVHRSTVKRELDRNSVEGEYKSEQAHHTAVTRKALSGFKIQLKLRLLHGKKRAGDFECLYRNPKKKIYQRRRRTFRLKKWMRKKRLQFYVKRKDSRPYYKHRNVYRSFRYKLWKPRYESDYRFRDNEKAEKNRTLRTRLDFQRYNHNPNPLYIRRLKAFERLQRKIRRERYWDWKRLQEARDLRELIDQQDKEREQLLAKIQITEPNHLPKAETVELPEPVAAEEDRKFFVFWWWVPEAEHKPVMLFRSG